VIRIFVSCIRSYRMLCENILRQTIQVGFVFFLKTFQKM